MNLSLISPEITLFCGALFILMADVFCGKKVKNFFYFSHLISLLFCAAALMFVMQNFVKSDIIFNQMFISNSFTSFAKAITILLLMMVILLAIGFVAKIQKIGAEFLSLMMIATCGGMVLISANDFLVFYLGLELQALSLYLLAALNRNSAKSSEAGMKYFILGCLASGLLLFGIAMIYGYAGTVNFSALMNLYHPSTEAALTTTPSAIPLAVMFGFILVLMAMFFKISAAPFHMWAPDVYEGSAPSAVTFFATVAKFTAVIALLRLFSTLIIGWGGIWQIFILVSLTSLVIGSFGAIFQKNFKRLLAYSSIGHMGFILLGLASLGVESLAAVTIYAVIYALISIGSFGFLTMIKNKNGDDSDAANEKTFAISSLSGLAKTNPVMAFSLAVLMFSTAGVPPLAGFFSKFYILVAALKGGLLPFAITAILFSVISAYYYLRVVKVMYFDEPANIIELEDFGNTKKVVFLSAIFNIILILFLNPLLNSIIGFLNN